MVLKPKEYFGYHQRVKSFSGVYNDPEWALRQWEGNKRNIEEKYVRKNV